MVAGMHGTVTDCQSDYTLQLKPLPSSSATDVEIPSALLGALSTTWTHLNRCHGERQHQAVMTETLAVQAGLREAAWLF